MPVFSAPHRSLRSTYAGSFIFDLHREFLFLDFAARKRNVFSRPGTYEPKKDNATLTGYRVLIITFIGFLLSCL